MITQDWVNILTPLVGPLLTAGGKALIPKIPKPVVPLLAVGLGTATNLLATKAIGSELDVLTAVLLGLAGIGVREAAKPVNPLHKKVAVV